MILGLLVVSVVPLAAAAFHVGSPNLGWRDAVMRAALAWGMGVLGSTEALGAFSALAFGPVLATWLSAHVALLVWIWPRRAKLTWPKIAPHHLLLAALPTLALATSLLAPPNTPDALSYHLPRQAMWIQQRSVEHFLTINDRALMMPPLAEMMQAHALLLSGSDAFANLPQCLAYALGLVVASLLARELGGGPRAQGLAALVFATLPMAWHEASSAKNDLLVALWLAIVACSAFRLARSGPHPLVEWLAAGAALGLAFATKTTALIFCLPVLGLLARAFWRTPRPAALFAVIALLPVMPHALRNFTWYGTPLGVHRAEDGGAQNVSVPTLRGTASNLLRNATLHLATPSPEVNRKLFSVVSRLHTWMGADVNDPRTTLWVLHYGVDWGPADEMVAGAPIQLLLGLATALVLLSRGPRTGPTGLAIVAIGGALLLYCLVLKWQPAGARLHLPAFVVLAAVIAAMAEKLGGAAVAVAAGLCVLGWLPSAETSDRPLGHGPRLWDVSRWDNYFRFDPSEAARQEACVRALLAAKISSLQIVTRHGFPWPLMRRWQREAGPGARFWGTLPESAHRPPDAVLVLEHRPHPPELHPPNTHEPFLRVAGTGPYALYVPASRTSATARAIQTLP